MSIPNDQLISLSDGASRLRVSYQQGRDMMLRGEVEGVRRGRNWFVTTQSVNRVLEAQRADEQAVSA